MTSKRPGVLLTSCVAQESLLTVENHQLGVCLRKPGPDSQAVELCSGGSVRATTCVIRMSCFVGICGEKRLPQEQEC